TARSGSIPLPWLRCRTPSTGLKTSSRISRLDAAAADKWLFRQCTLRAARSATARWPEIQAGQIFRGVSLPSGEGAAKRRVRAKIGPHPALLRSYTVAIDAYSHMALT